MILPCSSSELNVEVCLLNGQSFRFTKVVTDGKFPIIRGVAHNRVWQFERLDDQQIDCQVLARFDPAVESGDDDVLRAYFQLDVDLQNLYVEWSEDANFKKQLDNNFKHLTGIRILNQDVLETFFAFMCSSNNHVDRIKTMVNALCELYGDKIEVDLDGESHTFYNFPTLVQLFANRADMEDELKERKFGYRAAWIVKAVEKLTEIGGRSWLQELKYKPYSEASKALIDNFTGIGKKIADCICLMALEMNHVVPIDTHVFRITLTNYLPRLPKEYGKCNAKHFCEIQDEWVRRFGDYAGWCQSMLFTNELRAFQQQKPAKKKRK